MAYPDWDKGTTILSFSKSKYGNTVGATAEAMSPINGFAFVVLSQCCKDVEMRMNEKLIAEALSHDGAGDVATIVIPVRKGDRFKAKLKYVANPDCSYNATVYVYPPRR